MALDEDTVRLAKGKNLATVVTLMPDGQPQALPTWVDTDGEYLLVNTEPTRQRAKNLARDPRITVLIQASDDPWDWSEVRGHVVATVGGPEARQHIDELSRRYVGTEYSAPIGPGGPDHSQDRSGEDQHRQKQAVARASPGRLPAGQRGPAESGPPESGPAKTAQPKQPSQNSPAETARPKQPSRK